MSPKTNELDQFIQIKPPGSKEEFDALTAAAKVDNHGVIAPTDVIWRGGKQIGFLSIGAVPTTWAWLSTTDFSARDTREVFNFMEAVARRAAIGVYVPIPKSSPVHPHMDKLGYFNGGNYDFFFKSFL